MHMGYVYLRKHYLLPQLTAVILSVVATFALAKDSKGETGKTSANRALAQKILNDKDLQEVLGKAKALLKTGFHAGGTYPQVRIRDMNTFIEVSCEVNDHKAIKDSLIKFFGFQGENGNIPDGYLGNRTHKNTIETDQEASLVQACYKYVRKTGDNSLLTVVVKEKTVLRRMELALEHLLNERFSDEYGLIWGGTTVDWGDVQPEDSPGVHLNDLSHKAIDVYDNAMFLIAVDNYVDLAKDDKKAVARWKGIGKKTRKNVRKHLWDSKADKFIPHIYLNGSPFPEDFDEARIYYHGGTAVAIKAGLLSKKEIAVATARMVDNVRKSGAASIGLTVYPPYPEDFFKNRQLRKPYSYINGGDWTWFGGRMIQELIKNDFIEDAYDLSRPMVKRVLKNDGFFEWYSVNNEHRGSKTFRGSAGVLGKAIQMLLAWAEANGTGNKE